MVVRPAVVTRNSFKICCNSVPVICVMATYIRRCCRSVNCTSRGFSIASNGMPTFNSAVFSAGVVLATDASCCRTAAGFPRLFKLFKLINTPNCARSAPNAAKACVIELMPPVDKLSCEVNPVVLVGELALITVLIS